MIVHGGERIDLRGGYYRFTPLTQVGWSLYMNKLKTINVYIKVISTKHRVSEVSHPYPLEYKLLKDDSALGERGKFKHRGKL